MEFPLLDKLKSSDTSSTKNLISYKRASPDLSSAIVGYARDLLRFGNCLKDSLDLVGPPSYVFAWIVKPMGNKLLCIGSTERGQGTITHLAEKY